MIRNNDYIDLTIVSINEDYWILIDLQIFKKLNAEKLNLELPSIYKRCIVILSGRQFHQN